MRESIVLASLGLLSAPAFAQQFDMEAMSKWAGADKIRYHIVGEFRTTSHVARDGYGIADIIDRVVIDLTWKLSEAKLVGAPTIQNQKSTATNLRGDAPGCLPPILNGDFEFYDLLSVQDGLGGLIHFEVRTTYPDVQIAQVCTGGRRTVPAKVDERTEQFALPSPVLFAMPLPASNDVAVSSDKKSFIVKKNGWVWTLTPSIVR